jgi:metallo-beta-lactamase family protein
MKLQFLGAARQVTGSQYYLQTQGARVLIDCGMFQEREFAARNWNALPVRPRDIDAVLVTHAHIDHCGLLPRLVEEGFRGPVLATAPSVDLLELVLRDSAQIQAEDAQFKQKRHRDEGRKGKYPEKPLYTLRDVEHTIPLLQAVAYNQPVPVNSHLSVTFRDAGHILGSAMIELLVQQNDVFTGDMGQPHRPFVRDPSQFTEADYIVCESTYGDRTHEEHGSIEDQLAAAILRTIEAGGKMIIPIFAIERAQEVIYYLGRLVHAGRIPHVPVYLDSPMAAEVNEIFKRHRDCFAPDAQQEISHGEPLLGFPGLTTVRSVEQSKAINHQKGSAIIMATNGMCTAGRIKHHLAQYIDRPDCMILFVGYQASGTLGRQILDGNKEVRLHGRLRQVRVQVEHIANFSGHADRGTLLGWLQHFASPPKQLFVTHGEEESSLSLAQKIRDELHWNVTVPEYQQSFEL